MNTPKPLMLLVLGPHRSGTSLTARMLECLGAKHSCHLLPPQPDNPKGFFEDADVVRLNEDLLLPALGVDWFNLQPIDWSRLSDSVRSKLTLTATELLRKNYSGQRRLSILKDPRISCLLPFWLPVLERAGFETRAVCVLRDPLSVARSLANRNELSIAHAGALYAVTWSAIVDSLKSTQMAFVVFDDVFKDAQAALTMIAKSISLELPDDFTEHVEAFKESYLDRSLRHSSVPFSELTLEPELPPIATEVYRSLMSISQNGDAAKTFRRLAGRLQCFRQLSPLVKEYDRIVGEHHKIVDSLQAAQRTLQEAKDCATLERQEFSARLTALETEKNSLSTSLQTEQRRQRETKDTAALERQEFFARQATLETEKNSLTASLQGKERELSEIRGSTCWRLTWPLRKLGTPLRPLIAAAKRCHRTFRILYLHKRSGVFDGHWYLQHYADVRESTRRPFLHFAFRGAFEGRAPNSAFRHECYLSANPDVALAGLPASLHYVLRGFEEKRDLGVTPCRVKTPSQAKPLAAEALACGETTIADAEQWLKSRWRLHSPIRFFPTHQNMPRVSVVADSLASHSLFGGVATSLIYGALLANRLGASLRIITRTTPPDAAAVGVVLQANMISLQGNLEMCQAPLDGSRNVGLSHKEIFVATSWWSLRALRQSLPASRVIYLLQEDERMFYPRGDDYLRCAETLAKDTVFTVINTKLLHDHLCVGEGLVPGLFDRSTWFEPAFPGKRKFVRSQKAPRKLFFYARPHHERNLFALGLEALSQGLGKGHFTTGGWNIYFVGSQIPDLQLPCGAALHRVEGLDWKQYQNLVQEMDAGFCLMDTPHPSYPPLDLAACGAAVLTNACGSKTSLEKYSRNILVANPSVESLVAALRDLEDLALDEKQRAQNLRSDSISRNWQISFAEALEATMGSLPEEVAP